MGRQISILMNIYPSRLLVASQDGYLYVYSINSEGGDCQLLKRHDLRNSDVQNPKTGNFCYLI